MAIRDVICVCGATLNKDERVHYGYQCMLCVTREHELILAHGRGDDHDEIERLFSGPVDLGLQRRQPASPRSKAAA